MDDPIANSSMLTLPMITTPAARSFDTTVASYGGFQPSSIRLPQVVGMPRAVSTSLSASGTPASGPRRSPAARRRSTSRAAAMAPSTSTYRNALIRSSTFAIRSSAAWVASRALSSPAAIAAAVRAAEKRMTSVTGGTLTRPGRGCAAPGNGRLQRRARRRARQPATATCG